MHVTNQGSRIGLFLLSVTLLLAMAAPHVGLAQQRLGREFRINQATDLHAVEPSVAAADDGSFVVSWQAISDDINQETREEVFLRRFDADSVPAGAEMKVSTTEGLHGQSDVMVDPAGAFYAVVWEKLTDNSRSNVHGRVFEGIDSPVGGEFRVNQIPDRAGYPTIAPQPDGFVVAWSDSTEDSPTAIHARRFDSRGSAVGTELVVKRSSRSFLLDPDVASDRTGNFVVVWNEYEYGIFGRAFDARGAAVAPTFQVISARFTEAGYPVVAMDPEGDFVVAWEDGGFRSGRILARRFASPFAGNGTSGAVAAVGDEFEVGGDEGAFASAAFDARGRFVITWLDDSDESVFGQSFDESGEPLFGPFRVNTADWTGVWSPALAMSSDGRFTVLWEETGSSGHTDVHGNRFRIAKPILCDGRAATIVGSQGNDLLQGTRGNDVIHGREGNDTIRGLAGADVLCGGMGNDSIQGGGGADEIHGGDGRDTLSGDGGRDRLNGGPGQDHCIRGDDVVMSRCP
jgi:hypothetical protein